MQDDLRRALFSVESGAGYPPHRRPTQQESRRLLHGISDATHRSMAEIVRALPDRVVVPALTYPGIWELLAVDTLETASWPAPFGSDTSAPPADAAFCITGARAVGRRWPGARASAGRVRRVWH